MRRHGRIHNELLVLRCQEGDASAFEELVDRWQQRLWTHAYRLTSDEDVAWDALQDSWLAIVKSIGSLKDEAAFPAWAYRIVSNKCRDFIAKAQRHRSLVEGFSDPIPNMGDDLSDSREECASVQEAVLRLSARDRVLLSLYYQEDFSIAEIAGILDIPAGTVKSRLHYARKRVREALEEHPDA